MTLNSLTILNDVIATILIYLSWIPYLYFKSFTSWLISMFIGILFLFINIYIGISFGNNKTPTHFGKLVQRNLNFNPIDW